VKRHVCYVAGVLLAVAQATVGKISAEETVDTSQSDASVSTPLEIAPIIRMEESANLPAGRYELRAEYSMGEKAAWVQEWGLTRAKIDEVVAMIELVDGDDRVSAAAGNEKAGMGIWIVVIPLLASAVLAVAWARRKRQQYG
jgi:hypothetical protein